MGAKESRQRRIIENLNAELNKIKPIDRSKTKPIDRIDEIQELKTKLDQIKNTNTNTDKNIDKNIDNQITRDEINEWVKEQNKIMEDFKQKIRSDLVKERNIENDAKYIEMQKRVTSLEAINLSLEKKLGNISTSLENKQVSTSIIQDTIGSVLSHEQIDIFVERLLNDVNVNITYLPDFVERQIYRNMITILLGVVQNLSDTTEIKFLGHKMKLSVVPDNISVISESSSL